MAASKQLMIMSTYHLLVLFSQIFHLLSGVVNATTFTITNNCKQTIWPGLLSNAGVAPLSTTGFTLHTGESKSITPPSNWAGRFWARTHCSSTTSHFTCLTGDCGSGTIPCNSGGAIPPVTLVEFTLDGSGGQDFYDVSLVDGYNLPVVVMPRGGSGLNCSVTGCVTDLNGLCPSDLRLDGSEDGSGVVACRSACEKYGKPEFCCSGEFGGPDTCKPSGYSRVFKKACPTAYSYAYDDRSSTFVCGGGADYTITFCPEPSTSQKAASSSDNDGTSSSSTATPNEDGSSSTSTSTSTPIPIDGTGGSMVYMGALDVTSNGISSTPTPYNKWITGIGFLWAWWGIIIIIVALLPPFLA